MRLATAVFVLVLALAGCEQLLGIDEFTSWTASGSGGTAGSGGHAGGTGGSSSTGTGGSSSTGTGGSGGSAGAVSLELGWLATAVGPGDDDVWAVATDASGTVAACGNALDDLTFELSPETIPLPAGDTDTDMWVAHFSSDGTGPDARRYGATAVLTCRALAFTASSQLRLTGSANGAVTFSPTVGLDDHLEPRAYLAELDLSSFMGTMAEQLDGPCTYQEGVGLAQTSGGASLLGGQFTGQVTAGGLNISTSARSGFATSWSGSAWPWLEGIGDDAAFGEQVLPEDLAVAPNDDVVLVGSTSVEIKDPNSGSIAYYGGNDAFVIRLSSDGVLRWAVGAGWTGDDFAHGVAVDGEGNVYLAGQFTGRLDIGTSQYFGTAGGDADAFVLKLAANDGSPLWFRKLGEAGEQTARRLAVDSAGNVYVVGSFVGTIDLGGQSLTATNQDGFVIALDPGGQPRAGVQLESPLEIEALSIALAPSGSLIVGGSFQRSIDIQGTIRQGDPDDLKDGFIASFDITQ